MPTPRSSTPNVNVISGISIPAHGSLIVRKYVPHPMLTDRVATGFLWEVCTIDGFGTVLNYGLNKVRFPAGLKVDSRIRMHVRLAEVKDLGNGAEAVYGLTYEVEGEAKPCCVADLVFRYYN